MTRQEEFEKIKELIKENYEYGDGGIFNTRNIVGDFMTNIYTGENFTLDICYPWSYFEVFGMTDKEFEQIYKFYEDLEKGELVDVKNILIDKRLEQVIKKAIEQEYERWQDKRNLTK